MDGNKKVVESIIRFNKTSVLCILVGLLNMVMPMQKINKMIFGSYEEKLDPRSFDDINDDEVGFLTDYDRCNPVTKDEAMKKYHAQTLKSRARATSRI